MADYGTFSAIIDVANQRSGRPELLSNGGLASMLLMCIRDVQKDYLFDQDLVEAQLTATADPHVWDRPSGFRRFLLAAPGNSLDAHRNRRVYEQRPPSRHQLKASGHYYYGSGDSIIFTGHGSSGGIINLAYYTFVTPYVYYATEAERPATYDYATGVWSYKNATTDEEKEIARNAVSHWMMREHQDALVQGVLSRVWADRGDQRQQTAYSLWQQFKMNIHELTGAIAVGGYSS